MYSRSHMCTPSSNGVCTWRVWGSMRLFHVAETSIRVINVKRPMYVLYGTFLLVSQILLLLVRVWPEYFICIL